jgi:hypothetical protein
MPRATSDGTAYISNKMRAITCWLHTPEFLGMWFYANSVDPYGAFEHRLSPGRLLGRYDQKRVIDKFCRKTRTRPAPHSCC